MIRTARAEDAERLLEIYAYYVENTAITFEYDVPTEEEFRHRITSTLEKYPYIVCERVIEGRLRIVGYAYVGTFHARPAYDWAVETSIYVDHFLKKTGVGKELHNALEEILGTMHIINMNACIAVPARSLEDIRKSAALLSPVGALDAAAIGALDHQDPGVIGAPGSQGAASCPFPEDPHVDYNSVEFHAHLGYRMVGEFYQCGYKFDRWYNMVWMEKCIGSHPVRPLPIVPYPELETDL